MDNLSSDAITLFEPGDLKLIEQALSFNPDLEIAVYLTKLAKDRLSFPVSQIKELADALECDDGQVCCRDRVLCWKDMKKFMKSNMFPISNETDFLSKIYMALCIGTECHYHERRFMELRRDCYEESSQPNQKGKNNAYK